MTVKLLTPEDLAAEFGIDVDKLHDLRKRRNWPHVRLGRFDIRFTEEQARQIIAAHTVSVSSEADRASKAEGAGLTQRSAKRSA